MYSGQHVTPTGSAAPASEAVATPSITPPKGAPSGPSVEGKVDGVSLKPHRIDMSCIFHRDRVPQVVIKNSVLDDMRAIVKVSPVEIGWLTLVEQRRDDQGKLFFYVYDIIVPLQGVSATTTEIDPTWLQEEFAKGLDLSKEEDMKKYNDLRGWFHSHVHMQVNPSDQDDRQMKDFEENGCEWFIRGIANKHGMMKIDLFLYDIGIILKDVSWRPEEEEQETIDPLSQKWIEEVRKKAKLLQTQTTYSGKPVGSTDYSKSYSTHPITPSDSRSKATTILHRADMGKPNPLSTRLFCETVEEWESIRAAVNASATAQTSPTVDRSMEYSD